LGKKIKIWKLNGGIAKIILMQILYIFFYQANKYYKRPGEGQNP